MPIIKCESMDCKNNLIGYCIAEEIEIKEHSADNYNFNSCDSYKSNNQNIEECQF